MNIEKFMVQFVNHQADAVFIRIVVKLKKSFIFTHFRQVIKGLCLRTRSQDESEKKTEEYFHLLLSKWFTKITFRTLIGSNYMEYTSSWSVGIPFPLSYTPMTGTWFLILAKTSMIL